MQVLINQLKKNPTNTTHLLAVSEKLYCYYRNKLKRVDDPVEKFQLNLLLARMRESSTDILVASVDTTKLQTAADAFNIPKIYNDSDVVLLKERADAWYARRVNPFGPFIDLEKMEKDIEEQIKKCVGMGWGNPCEDYTNLTQKLDTVQKCRTKRRNTENLTTKARKKARKHLRDVFENICSESDSEYLGRLKGYIEYSSAFKTFTEQSGGNKDALSAVQDFFELNFPDAVKSIDRKVSGKRFDLQTKDLGISKLVDLISLDGTISNNTNEEFSTASTKMKEVVVANNIISVFLTSMGEVMDIVSGKTNKLQEAEGNYSDSESDDEWYIDPNIVYSVEDVLKTPASKVNEEDEEDEWYIDPNIVYVAQKTIEDSAPETVPMPQLEFSNKISEYIETTNIISTTSEGKEEQKATEDYLANIKHFYTDSATRIDNALDISNNVTRIDNALEISKNVKSAATNLRIKDVLHAPSAILTNISDRVGATSPKDFIIKLAKLLWSGPGKIYEGIAWICKQIKHLLAVAAAKIFGTMKLLLGSFINMVIWPIKKLLKFLRVSDKLINSIVGIVGLIAPLFGFVLASLAIFFCWPVFAVIGASSAGILSTVFSTIASSLVSAIVTPFISFSTLFASAGPMMVGQQIATIIFGPVVAVIQMLAALITGGIGAGGLSSAITALISGKLLQGVWLIISSIYSWWYGQSQNWYSKLKSFLKPLWWISLTKILGFAAIAGNLARAQNKNLANLEKIQGDAVKIIRIAIQTITEHSMSASKIALLEIRDAEEIKENWDSAIKAMEMANKTNKSFHRLFRVEADKALDLYNTLSDKFKNKLKSYKITLSTFPEKIKLKARVSADELKQILSENSAIKSKANEAAAAAAASYKIPIKTLNNAHFHMTHLPHIKLTMMEKIALMGYDSPLHFISQHPMHPTHTYTRKWIEHESTLHYRLH